jgi:hypothetical protein
MSSYANGIRYSERIFGMKNHPLRRDRIIGTAWDDRDSRCWEFLYSGWWGLEACQVAPAYILKQINAHKDFTGWEDSDDGECPECGRDYEEFNEVVVCKCHALFCTGCAGARDEETGEYVCENCEEDDDEEEDIHTCGVCREEQDKGYSICCEECGLLTCHDCLLSPREVCYMCEPPQR